MGIQSAGAFIMIDASMNPLMLICLPGNAQVQGLLQGIVDSLAYQPVEVNRPAQKLHMALLQKCFIPENKTLEVKNLFR